MAFVAMDARNETEYAAWLENTAFELMDKFAAKFETLLLNGGGALYGEEYWVDTDKNGKNALAQKIIRDILSESVGFAGCKMARRQLGVAHILEIDGVEDDWLRAQVETKVLKIAREMVVRYGEIDSVQSLKQLITDIK
jgi:5-methylthioribose kinase